MAETLGIYKCNICGNVVEVLHAGGGDLSCCGAPMEQLIENTVDAAKEKHIPVVTKMDGGYKVSVGSVDHPMTDEHYIEWIEIIADNSCYRQFLNPGDVPEAVFAVSGDAITARAHCNLHGVWKA